MPYKRFLLLITSLYILISPLSVYCSPDSYNLTTGEELGSIEKQQDIKTYWNNIKKGAFTGYGGIPIRYGYTVNKKGKGAIVIVNGRGETYLKYKETAYDLYRQGYSVYMYDHRGQGLSGRMLENPQIGYVKNFNHYVHDLKKFHQKVVAKNESGNIYLLAHSMGGAIAALYLEKYQDDFQAAVLSSPMMEIDTGIVPTAVSCITAKSLRSIRQLMGRQPSFVPFTGPYEKKPFSENRLTHSRIRYGIITSIYEKRPEIRLGGPSCAWVTEACQAGRKAGKEAGRINIPVLVLQAGQDELVTAKGQRRFCKNLAGGGKSQCRGGEPYLIRDAYHELLFEKDEYRIPALTRIIDFLKSR